MQINNLSTTRIELELDPSLVNFLSVDEKSNTLVFEQELTDYLNNLVSDLGIPTKVSLNISRNEIGDKPLKRLYRITINGRRCRIQLTDLLMVQRIDPLEFTNSIAKTIVDNRELFFTQSLSKKILTKWRIEKDLIPLQYQDFHKLLDDIIKRGLSIKRIYETNKFRFDPKLVTTNSSKWEDFVECTHDLDSITIKVFLNHVQYSNFITNDTDTSTPSDRSPSLKQLLEQKRTTLSNELGIIYPKIEISDSDSTLEENEVRIQLNDIRFPRIHIVGPIEDLLKHIVTNVENAIRQNINFFVTIGTIKYSLRQLKLVFPDLVNTTLRRFDVITLTRILRDLLNEGLSIMNFRYILESLLAIKGVTNIDYNAYLVFSPYAINICPVMQGKKIDELDIDDYSNCLRISLKQYISEKYTNERNYLRVCQTDAQLEARIKDIDIHPLTYDEHEKLIESIFDAIKKLFDSENNKSNPVVIVTTLNLRRRLKKLIEKEFPMVAVLCQQELSPNTNIIVRNKISWNR